MYFTYIHIQWKFSLQHLKNNKLTVRSKTENGREKGELESFVYNIVSFSAPNRIASSNKIAGNKIKCRITNKINYKIIIYLWK